MSERHHSETAGEYRKYRKQSGWGKGDKRRPGDDDAFRDGWDRIFGRKSDANLTKDRALESRPGNGPGSAPEFA